MKLIWLVLIAVLLVSAVVLPMLLWKNADNDNDDSKQDVFIGVTFGGNTTREAKLLIDKVKAYTNLFVVDSWEISTNETALTEICDYAVAANLSVMVYFDFIFYNVTSNVSSVYNSSSWNDYSVTPWHIPWLNNASERWGDKFLGVYLYDEPGGNQIDKGYWGGNNVTFSGNPVRTFENVSDYGDAASRFVASINRSRSMQLVTNTSIPNGIKAKMPVFTSDYALYWFDYQAGYDVIFAELGGTRGANSKIQQIALCRGAANVQNKQWGVMITWAIDSPPYLESGEDVFHDVITAYDSGAKYMVVFNYPQINEFGALTEEHFAAIEKAWNYVHSFPRKTLNEGEQVALVLPKDYGWGMRSAEDKIWGFWPADESSPVIWDKMTRMIDRYGVRLDIIYDDARSGFGQKYKVIYYWNSTIG
jgi:hypothetical protein